MTPNSPDDWQTLFDELPIDATVDEQQSQSLKQQVLQTYDDRVESSWWNRLSTKGHYLMTHKTTRWAATAAALFLAAWLLMSTGTRSTFAMEQLLETVLNARNVRFVMTVQSKDLPPSEIKIFCSEPAKMRMDSGDGQVTITDFEIGKALLLDSEAKTAMASNLSSTTAEDANVEHINYFESYRTLFSDAQENPNDSIKLVGEKEIDGRTLFGFELRDASNPMTIWADPETNQPYFAEIKPAGSAGMEITMSKFEFNVDLDDAMFSVEVPEGYQQTDMPQLPQEDHLVESLSMYSESSGGQFPDELSLKTAMMFDHDFPDDTVLDEDGELPPAVEEKIMKFGQGFNFAIFLPADAQAHYAGKGVTHGKSDQPIFWYLQELAEEELEEDRTWRVLGADLKFSDADSAPDVEGAVPQLPLVPQ